jgi:hypothetical protein
MGTKIWLDDAREAPDGWIRCLWPEDVVELVLAGGVELVSLDHDLGDDDRGTGHDVVVMLEEYYYDILGGDHSPEFKLPDIQVHSANPVGRNRIKQGAEQLVKLAAMLDRVKVDPLSSRFQEIQTLVKADLDGVGVRLLSAINDMTQDVVRLRVELDGTVQRATLDTANGKIRFSLKR